MTDHKFTDDDVIKALECCVADGCPDCDECPFNKCCCDGTNKMLNNALSLINRQKAEIERLIACIDSASAFLEEQHKRRTQEHKVQMEMLDQIKEQIPLALARAKAEAIKEFAERLKPKLSYYDEYIVDTLVREMTEETEL